MRRLALLTMITVPLAVPHMAGAADWPGWLGPARDGRSTETPTWSSVAKAWSAPMGVGYSGMAIADGLVWTMADEGERQFVIALDAASGEVRWKKDVGGHYPHSMGFPGPRTTPAVVDGALITTTPAGVLWSLDAATGETRWSVDLVAVHGAEAPSFGFSGSPLISKGVIYLDIGGTRGGLVALSAADGTTVWQSGTAKAGYASPVRATLGGVDQVVFFTGKTVLAANPATGATLWSLPWSTSYDVNAATPLVLDGQRLFVASGYGHGGAEITVAPGAGGAAITWSTKRMKNKHATSVLHEGVLYGFNETRFAAIDATTGEELWMEEGYGRGTLIGVGDELVVLAEDCRLLRVRADAKAFKVVGKPMEPFSEGPCWTTPALADGRLYLRSQSILVAVDVK